MKSVLVLALSLCLSMLPTSLMAASKAKPHVFALTMDLSIEGGPVHSMSLIVLEGQLGMISDSTDERGPFIEALATQTPQGILMKFAVGTISKKGERLVLSRPEILAQENERAQITVGETNPPQELISLAVVAKRIPSKP